MSNEQLPELNKGEPAFWAGEQGLENDSDENAGVTPEAEEELRPLSREELARLAAQLAIPSATKPPEEGSDTYLG